jgi:NAD(P)-dependent dehydrogenase (short-subunit alcohol dehydrogenase family)
MNAMGALAGKTVLVTGASSGIGKATVELLIEAGATVYAAARRVERMQELGEKGALPVSMDLTDETSLRTGVQAILQRHGSIDILINNAGYGSYGAIEDVPLEEARRQFEVNIFGLARITQLVLPSMRKAGYGKIVNISSMGGKIYTRFGGWYHATKHALEGFSDCLRLETELFGIDVVIVEPGAIRSEWGTITAENLRKCSGKGVYRDAALKVADNLAKWYSSKMISEPVVVARVILKALTARKPKTRYVTGAMAGPALFFRHWLGDRIFDRLVKMAV